MKSMMRIITHSNDSRTIVTIHGIINLSMNKKMCLIRSGEEIGVVVVKKSMKSM